MSAGLPLQGLPFIVILGRKGQRYLATKGKKLMGEPGKGVERPKNEPHKWPLVRYFKTADEPPLTPKPPVSSSSMNWIPALL